MIVFSKFKIGYKIAILPILAIIGLIIISYVNTILRLQVSDMNTVIHKTHEAAISLTQQLYLESNYLSNPDETLQIQIENKSLSVSKLINECKKISSYSSETDLLNTIEKINKKHNDIFSKARDIVLEILDHQNELTAVFHESDNLAGGKVDEISLLITHLMIEGKDLSASKRELRNSLREFISLTSNAMLNTNELLFFSDSGRYEKAEKKRSKNLSLVTRACSALSLVTGDQTDEVLWIKINGKQDRIKELRDHIFDHWKIREVLSEDLKLAHKEIQETIQILINNTNNKTKHLIITHKRINFVTFSTILIALLLSGFFLVRNITNPIQELTHAVSSFKKGENVRINSITQDEIGDLTTTFNVMIQHRLKVEKKLRQSETRFRQLAENINEVFWIVSPDWNEVIYVSPAYEHVWGRSCKSLYENPRQWMDSIDADDIEKVSNYIKSKISGNLSEIVFPVYRVIRSDGSIRSIFTRGFPVRNDEGEVYRIVGIAEDITEQKQLDQKFL